MNNIIDFDKPHIYIIFLLLLVCGGVLCNYIYGDKGTFIYIGVVLLLLGIFFILGGIFGT